MTNGDEMSRLNKVISLMRSQCRIRGNTLTLEKRLALNATIQGDYIKLVEMLREMTAVDVKKVSDIHALIVPGNAREQGRVQGYRKILLSCWSRRTHSGISF